MSKGGSPRPERPPCGLAAAWPQGGASAETDGASVAEKSRTKRSRPSSSFTSTRHSMPSQNFAAPSFRSPARQPHGLHTRGDEVGQLGAAFVDDVSTVSQIEEVAGHEGAPVRGGSADRSQPLTPGSQSAMADHMANGGGLLQLMSSPQYSQDAGGRDSR